MRRAPQPHARPTGKRRPVVCVVLADSGDYEDARTWPVAAFTDKAAAGAFAFRAKGRADEATTAWRRAINKDRAHLLRLARYADLDPGVEHMVGSEITYRVVPLPFLGTS